MNQKSKRNIKYAASSVIGTALGYTLYKGFEGERNEVIATGIEFLIKLLELALDFFK